MGNYLESLKYAVDHLALSKQLKDTSQEAFAHLVFGHDYKYSVSTEFLSGNSVDEYKVLIYFQAI